MEPQGSLPCSQEPTTGPYPEPYQSNPHHPILRFILILSTNLHLGLPSGLFPSGFPTNILHAFLFSPHSCYMPRGACLKMKQTIPKLKCHDKISWRSIYRDLSSVRYFRRWYLRTYMTKPTGGYELLLTRGVIPAVLLALCCTRKKGQPFIRRKTVTQGAPTVVTLYTGGSGMTYFHSESLSCDHIICGIKLTVLKLIFQGMHRSLAKQDQLIAAIIRNPRPFMCVLHLIVHNVFSVTEPKTFRLSTDVTITARQINIIHFQVFFFFFKKSESTAANFLTFLLYENFTPITLHSMLKPELYGVIQNWVIKIRIEADWTFTGVMKTQNRAQ
jgi:hypothetical protein